VALAISFSSSMDLADSERLEKDLHRVVSNLWAGRAYSTHREASFDPSLGNDSEDGLNEKKPSEAAKSRLSPRSSQS
jgi:hypothetical protein